LPIACEPLEDRTLLATLDITSGALSFASTTGVADNLTISTTGPSGKYTFTDPSTTITLTPGALHAGWTGSGTSTVTGPDSSVTSIAVDTKDANDAVIVKSTDASVALTFTNASGNVDTVTIGGDSSKGAQAVNGSVSINNVKGTTVLVVDDSANTKALTGVSLAGTKITGLLPGTNTIDASKASLTSLTYDEGKGGTTLTVSSTPKAPATTIVNTGVGAVNATTVQAVAGPLTIDAHGVDTITVGAAPLGVQGLASPVTLETSGSGVIAALNVDDSADIVGQTATISGTAITGLAPNPINFGSASIEVMNVKGGEGGNTFTVAGLPDAIVNLGTGAGATIDPSNPNPNTVNIQDTTDPANNNLLNVNGQGLDTINLSPGVGVNVTGSTKLLTIPISMTIHAPGPNDVVTFTNSSTGSINGPVQVVAAPASTALTLDDSNDPNARTVTITQGVITGLVPAAINYDPDDITSLTIIGGTRYATLNINASKHGPVSVVPGANTGSGTVTIDTQPPLIYANAVAVNVTNAADQDLIPQGGPVMTTTGDLPLEGKSLPYLVASFVDDDPNARSGNFTAVVDWGDGSPMAPASISSQGFLDGQPLFDVTASHLYAEAGTYPVVVHITDLGTAAVPSIIAGIPVTETDLGGSGLTTGTVAQVNLVSNGPIPASNTDPNLVDAWGIAASPTGPLWVGDRGTGLATVYDGSGTPGSPVVTIPGGSPTGVAFNPVSGAFDLSPGDPSTSAVFLFVNEAGMISGWNPGVSPATAITTVDNSAAGAVYTGLAVADNGGSEFLYAANFHSGMVEMYGPDFSAAGSFTDSTLPPGYAPYNVADIGGDLYVTFAKQDAAGRNPVAGLGNGYIDVFSPSGVMLSRFASNAPLDEPWGMALAPSNFGQFSGDLLVANHGDGRILAFDPATGAYLGPFIDGSNQPVVIDGLHGLIFGNGGSAGATNTLFFTAGPVGGSQGLLGTLTPAPNTATIGEAALSGSAAGVSAVEGNPFVGVVANFTDANPLSQASDFSAMIDWGDGSPPSAGEVLTGNGLGAYIVFVDGALAHTYTDETGSPLHPQPYNISVAIAETDGSGASVHVAGFANVADAGLVSATGVDPTGVTFEGNPLAAGPITLATFIDGNPLATPADYIANGVAGAATINWGDGSTSLGTIVDTGPTALGESFAVTGNHTYLKVGPSSISISVVDIGGKSTSMVANVDVLDAPLAAAPAALAGVEGFPLLNAAGSDLVQVASFTDGNPLASPIDFRATLDWGDGSGGSGTILSGGAPGAFIVLASHKYAEAGTYPINIIIDDSAGDLGGSRTTTTSAAVIADAPLMNIAPNPVGGTEGSGLSAPTLGTFTDINPAAKTADFTVTINWGDTTPLDTLTGTVAITGGNSVGISAAANIAAGTGTNFKITGSHTYKEEGSFTITTTVTDADGATFTLTTTASIKDATLSAIGAPSFPGVAGVPLSVTNFGAPIVATFNDANPSPDAGDFSATTIVIDWGDGTPTTAASSITQQGGASGTFFIQADHTYAAPGDYQVLIIIPDAGGSRTVATAEAIVTAGPPQIAPLGVIPVAAVEGQPVNNVVVASFNDANPFDTAATFSAQVTWGDAPTPFAATVVKTAFDDYDVLASHTYAEDTTGAAPYAITVTIGDIPGVRLVINNTATVADAPLSSIGAPSIPGAVGVPLSVTNFGAPIVATFTDSNPAPAPGDFAAANVIVDWGDGTPNTAATAITQQGAATGFTYFVAANHTYAAPGDYQVLVIISDAGGSRTVATTEAIVTAGPPAPVALPAIPIQAVEGQLLNNVVVASFHDNNPFDTAAVFSAQVTWGDAPTPYAATVLKTAFNDYDVLASHTYAEETAVGASYPVTVTIGDTAGDNVVINNTATVADAPLASIRAPSIPGVVGVPLSVTNFGAPIVATFTDSNPAPDAGDFTAATVVIDWGDGTPSTPATSITQHGSATGYTYFVQADHTYAAPGDYQILIIIPDAGGSRTVATSEAIVKKYTLSAAGATANIPEGESEAGRVIGFIYDDNPDAQLADPQITSENPDITVSDANIVPVVGTTTSYTYEITADIEGNDSESGGAEQDGGALTIYVYDANDGNATETNTQVYLYDPVLIDPGVAVQAVAGSAFQGNVATFSTTDLKAGTGEFAAVINWGDGQTSQGTIVATGAGHFRVVGDHTYAQPGSFTISSTISDDEGKSVSDASTAAVSAPSIVAQGLSVAPGRRGSFSGNVATFTSPVAVPPGQFAAVINWGDGTTSSGVVTSSAGPSGVSTFTVSGSHHFAKRKLGPATVTIVESGGGQAVISLKNGHGTNHRGAGAAHGPIVKASHPRGARALLTTAGHLKKDWPGIVPLSRRTAARNP
jgi:uncharacterized protein (TIGR03118 family)